MSRIFTIEGNFKQGGKWSQPDPSFKGEIAVEDDGDGLFSGYCDELYDSVSEDKTRYLFGFLVQNEEGEVEGAAFFKLSNDRKQAQLVYLVPSPKSGRQMQWGAMLPLFGGEWVLNMQGEATVSIKEKSYSEEAKNTIDERLRGLYESIGYNMRFLGKLAADEFRQYIEV